MKYDVSAEEENKKRSKNVYLTLYYPTNTNHLNHLLFVQKKKKEREKENSFFYNNKKKKGQDSKLFEMETLYMSLIIWKAVSLYPDDIMDTF